MVCTEIWRPCCVSRAPMVALTPLGAQGCEGGLLGWRLSWEYAQGNRVAPLRVVRHDEIVVHAQVLHPPAFTGELAAGERPGYRPKNSAMSSCLRWLSFAPSASGASACSTRAKSLLPKAPHSRHAETDFTASGHCFGLDRFQGLTAWLCSRGIAQAKADLLRPEQTIFFRLSCWLDDLGVTACLSARPEPAVGEERRVASINM